MAEHDTTKKLEMRIVELENAVKVLRPAPTGLSEDELKTYYKANYAYWACWRRCINECDPVWLGSPIEIAGSLVNIARFAEIAGLVSKESVEQLTTEVTKGLATKA